jgi:hypothetical protein
MSTTEELEKVQLRLSLLALHRRVLFLGPLRNFFIMFVFLTAITGAVIYFYHTSHFLKSPFLLTFLFTIPVFALHKSYFIDLPRTKSVLTFFEQNHPELCLWLPESALLEAKMLYEEKAL